MHDGMPYDAIHSQGHSASEVPKIALCRSISSATYRANWQMITDS